MMIGVHAHDWLFQKDGSSDQTNTDDLSLPLLPFVGSYFGKLLVLLISRGSKRCAFEFCERLYHLHPCR